MLRCLEIPLENTSHFPLLSVSRKPNSWKHWRGCRPSRLNKHTLSLIKIWRIHSSSRINGTLNIPPQHFLKFYVISFFILKMLMSTHINFNNSCWFYCVSLIRHRLRIVAAQSEVPSKIKRAPWIVATTSEHGAQMRMLILAANAHWAISRAVCVLRLVSAADSRTKRLPLSIRLFCITHI